MMKVKQWSKPGGNFSHPRTRSFLCCLTINAWFGFALLVSVCPNAAIAQDSDSTGSADAATQDKPERRFTLDDIKNPPLGVLDGRINNELIYRVFLRTGQLLNKNDDVMSPEQIVSSLRKSKKRSSEPVPELGPVKDSVYQSMAKSTLLFGTVFDCGRCSKLHASIAGGVVVSSDGLAITNYHVLERENDGTEEIYAISFDGKPHPIKEILSANKTADVALVRLGGEGPYFPSPIAKSMPAPLDPVTILSHPKNNFFVLTQGVVSRHVRLSRRSGEWTEVTADYAAGSSGSGIFNSKGEVVGLVSRNHPIIRQRSSRLVDGRDTSDDDKPKKRSLQSSNGFAEMVLRRCVTQEAIRGMFAE